MRVRIFVLFLFCYATCRAQDVDFEKQIAGASDDSLRIAVMLKGAWELKYSDPERSLRFADRAISLASKNKFSKQEASAYYYKSIIYYLTGKYDSAMFLSGQALQSYQKLNDDYGIASIYNLQGLVQEKTGDFQDAISNYHQSLVFATKTDNLYGQSNPLHNIGLIYSKTDDHRQSLNYFLKALAVREKIGDSTLIAQSYESIGVAHMHLGDTSKSIEFQEKALRFFSDSDDTYDLAGVYSNLGVLYTQTNNFVKAETYLRQALQLQKENLNPEGEVKALINLAELYNDKGKFEQGMTFAQTAIVLCDSLNLLPEAKLAYENIVISYEGLKQFKEGFTAQKKLRAITDTLLNAEKVTQIATLETRYQVKEKEQEISLQRARLDQTYGIIVFMAVVIILISAIFLLVRSRHKKQQRLMEKENELTVREAYITASIRSQEDERKRFARDIHDGMGQLISALKLILLPVSRNISLEERISVVERSERLLNEMHDEIRRIAFNLMPHTLVQHGLVPALKEAFQRINATGKIVVRVSSFDIAQRLAEVQEVSLYRIIQEWINNVIKYAEATVVEVQVIGHENEITVTIEDNGQGFDTTTLTTGSGNGWKNIQSRANLLKGTVEVDSSPGRSGTTLTIKIPFDQKSLNGVSFTQAASK